MYKIYNMFCELLYKKALKSAKMFVTRSVQIWFSLNLPAFHYISVIVFLARNNGNYIFEICLV